MPCNNGQRVRRLRWAAATMCCAALHFRHWDSSEAGEIGSTSVAEKVPAIWKHYVASQLLLFKVFCLSAACLIMVNKLCIYLIGGVSLRQILQICVHYTPPTTLCLHDFYAFQCSQVGKSSLSIVLNERSNNLLATNTCTWLVENGATIHTNLFWLPIFFYHTTPTTFYIHSLLKVQFMLPHVSLATWS